MADGPVVLVGHSGDGAIAPPRSTCGRTVSRASSTSTASGPLGDGGVINDEFPAENGEVPLPDWSLFEEEDLDDGLRAAFRERANPSPVHVTSDPQQLCDKRRYDIPVTVIACEFSSVVLREWMAQGHPLRAPACEDPRRRIHRPAHGHWPQFTRPEELGRAILTGVGPA